MTNTRYTELVRKFGGRRKSDASRPTCDMCGQPATRAQWHNDVKVALLCSAPPCERHVRWTLDVHIVYHTRVPHAQP